MSYSNYLKYHQVIAGEQQIYHDDSVFASQLNSLLRDCDYFTDKDKDKLDILDEEVSYLSYIDAWYYNE